MAMVGTTMGTAIWNAVKGLTIPQDRVMTDGECEAYWQAIGTAIVTHIANNAKATGTDSPTGDSHNLDVA